ncbi:unnamed protein product [Dibothriocephalus latus]|uniref:Uncharacterized protein n=1 Tax=Dibothriocephalus latus TaxID=60516 RepID=A0A3P7PF27_DIBLA|nr:unnamed protein product [Dibothriocephalus latus]
MIFLNFYVTYQSRADTCPSNELSRDRNSRALLKEQESLIKNVLERFDRLRIIFGDTMEKKLELAASLAAQQG